MVYHSGWGNPLTELIGKENKTCKGCEHQKTDKAFGITVNYCQVGRKHMHKCDNYKELPTRKKE